MGKKFQLRKDTLSVYYTFKNGGGEAAEFFFSPSLDFSFSGEGEGGLRIFRENEDIAGESDKVSVRGADVLKFQDMKNEVQLIFGSTRPFDAWIIPRRASCASDKGFPAYQSTAFYPLQKVNLAPGESCETGFTLKITR
jgi:hypothetical protein